MAVRRVFTSIEQNGPPLSLLVDLSKYGTFSPTDVSLFTGGLKRSCLAIMNILGVPIADLEFCTSYISNKHETAKICLRKLKDVGARCQGPSLIVAKAEFQKRKKYNSSMDS